MEIITQTAFDYIALDSETRIVVQQRTSALREKDGHFRGLVRQTAETVWLMGEDLAVVQEKLRGTFLDWLRAEFPQWSKSSAYRFMDVHRAFEFPNLGNFNGGISALYLLASPSTPESVRQTAIERTVAGETITYPEARTMVNEARNPSLAPVSPNGDKMSTTVDNSRPAAMGTIVPTHRPTSPIHRIPVDDYDTAPDESPTVQIEDDEPLTPYEQQLAARYDDSPPPDSTPTPALLLDRQPSALAVVESVAPRAVHQLLTSSESNEWYTPAAYIEAARLVMGAIDLDPASNEIAQQIVKAAQYFTIADDGLARKVLIKSIY